MTVSSIWFGDLQPFQTDNLLARRRENVLLLASCWCTHAGWGPSGVWENGNRSDCRDYALLLTSPEPGPSPILGLSLTVSFDVALSWPVIELTFFMYREEEKVNKYLLWMSMRLQFYLNLVSEFSLLELSSTFGEFGPYTFSIFSSWISLSIQSTVRAGKCADSGHSEHDTSSQW
jgi:hypothetical protein